MELGSAVMISADATEGPRALLEKRLPKFTGEWTRAEPDGQPKAMPSS